MKIIITFTILFIINETVRAGPVPYSNIRYQRPTTIKPPQVESEEPMNLLQNPSMADKQPEPESSFYTPMKNIKSTKTKDDEITGENVLIVIEDSNKIERNDKDIEDGIMENLDEMIKSYDDESNEEQEDEDDEQDQDIDKFVDEEKTSDDMEKANSHGLGFYKNNYVAYPPVYGGYGTGAYGGYGGYGGVVGYGGFGGYDGYGGYGKFDKFSKFHAPIFKPCGIFGCKFHKFF